MKSPPAYPLSVYVVAWVASIYLMLMVAWAYRWPDPEASVELFSVFGQLLAAGGLVWGRLRARVQAGETPILTIVGQWLATQARVLVRYVRRLVGRRRTVHASIEGHVAAGMRIEGHPTMVAHAPGQGASLEERVSFLEGQYTWLKKERDTAKVERGQMREAIDELAKADRKLERRVSELRVESLVGGMGPELAALGWIVVALVAELFPGPILWLLEAYS